MFKKKDYTQEHSKKERKFKKFKEEHFNEIDYLYYEKLYTDIKLEYINKIKNSNYNIKVERARIEDLSNKNLGLFSTIMINIIIIAITFLITNVYEGIINIIPINIMFFKNSQINVLISKMFFAFILYFTMLFSVKKSFSYETKKEKFYNLCLRVLDDIEKEMEEEKRMNIKNVEDEKVQKLIAATLETTQSKNKSLIKRIFRKINL